jgi:hypothetical protein
MTAPELCAGMGQKPERYEVTGRGRCGVCRRAVAVSKAGLIGKHQARRLKKPSDLEQALLTQIRQAGLPAPEREYRFDWDRGWRFDLAWPYVNARLPVITPNRPQIAVRHPRTADVISELLLAGSNAPVAVDIQGAIWTGGKHGRGGGIELDHAKHNAAVLAGWRVLIYSRKPIMDGTAISQIATLIGGPGETWLQPDDSALSGGNGDRLDEPR